MDFLLQFLLVLSSSLEISSEGVDSSLVCRVEETEIDDDITDTEPKINVISVVRRENLEFTLVHQKKTDYNKWKRKEN